MKGQEHFFKARLSGSKPVLGVTFTRTDNAVLKLRTVVIEPQDRPEKADLRFVIGLNVVIHGFDRAETLEWCQACHKAGAQFAARHIFNAKGKSLDAFVIFKTGQFVECPQ